MEKQKGELGFELVLIKEKHKEIRTTVIISAAVLASLGIVGLICYLIAQNGFSVESLLSTILAIFSIVISMMFYFKTDTASSKFYDKVYEFNDTQHSLLASINSLFTEKFKNLDDKFDRMEIARKEIKSIEEEKGEIVDKFAKANKIPDADKEKLLQELSEKDREIDSLKMTFEKYKNSNDDRWIYNSKFAEKFVEKASYYTLDLLKSFSKEELNEALRKGYFNLKDIDEIKAGILKNQCFISPCGKITPEGQEVLAYLLTYTKKATSASQTDK